MAKITISVPDELHRKLQEIKGDVKVSKICQTALNEAIRFASLSKSREIKFFQQKLREERNQLFKPSYDDGLQDGIKDAFSMGYLGTKEFNELYREYPYGEVSVYEGFASNEEKYFKIREGEIEYDINISFFSDDNDDLLFELADAYLYGWTEGVRSILVHAEHSNLFPINIKNPFSHSRHDGEKNDND